jgi:hypothetical protein
MIKAMKRARRLIALLAAITALLRCDSGTTDPLAGGGSGTGNANTIAGVLVKPNGKPPLMCNVSCYRADIIPDTWTTADSNGVISRDSTNNDGRFILRNIPAGRYNIFCADSIESFSKLIFNASVKQKDSIFIGVDTLRVNKDFSGIVNNANGVQTIAFIYGSPFITSIKGTSGAFYMNNLPSGDSILVTFKALEPINGKNCTAEYLFGHLPDTTLFVSISLKCN